MLSSGSEWDSDSAGERAWARAPVTPRVYAPHTGEPLPLADCVRRLMERRVKGRVCLHGPPGSGKSTALRYLKAVLPSEGCPHLLDGIDDTDEFISPDTLTIYTGQPTAGPGSLSFQMAAWSQDDCIEYLLAVHPSRCASVMPRIQALPNAAMLGGLPELWCILLDAFAHDESMNDIAVALRLALSPLLTLHGGPIGLFCLETICQGNDLSNYLKLGLPTSAGRLVRHRPVQLVLAADRIVEELSAHRGPAGLDSVIPDDLMGEVARLARFWPSAVEQLNRLTRRQDASVQAMAISTLVALDPAWRPTRRPARLAKALLRGVQWSRVDLAKADLTNSHFEKANLRHAKLRCGRARSANFAGANLRFASIGRLQADHADFSGADLSYARANRLVAHDANFKNARLDAASMIRAQLKGCDLTDARCIGAQASRADLSDCHLAGADFTDANLRLATLDRCDLTRATFDRTLFGGASMQHCNFSEMQLRLVDFRNANLTGSDFTSAVMRRGNFERANLSSTGLADVEWDGANLRLADLRNASFHLGSTRSGLVGSTIPSEGSRTGFYTDDYDDQTHKSPEEIRKASLCGADLRGANIDGVDFYLVDLRGAQYSDAQREHFASCRAILD